MINKDRLKRKIKAKIQSSIKSTKTGVKAVVSVFDPVSVVETDPELEEINKFIGILRSTADDFEKWAVSYNDSLIKQITETGKRLEKLPDTFVDTYDILDQWKIRSGNLNRKLSGLEGEIKETNQYFKTWIDDVFEALERAEDIQNSNED